MTVIQNLIDISSVINSQTKNNLNMAINQDRSSTSILLTSHCFLVYLSYLFPFALIGCCDNFAFTSMKLKWNSEFEKCTKLKNPSKFTLEVACFLMAGNTPVNSISYCQHSHTPLSHFIMVASATQMIENSVSKLSSAFAFVSLW